jgi:hypothetical protein
MKKALLFSALLAALVSQAQLQVISSGNVGIGTSSPYTLLHLYNGSNVGPTLTLSAPSGGTPGINFRPFDPGSSNPAQAAINSTDDGSYGGTLHFFTKVDGTSGGALTERMTILGGSGNVGIGTGSPGYRLTIAGGSSAQPFYSSYSPSNDYAYGLQSDVETSYSHSKILLGTWNGTNEFYVYANGQIYGYGYNKLSDRRVKNNITPLTNSLARVLKLQGVTYYYNKPYGDADVKYMGLIAQDVQKVVPEVVMNTDTSGLLAVQYQNLTALLIEAIKEEDSIIKIQKLRMDSLQNQIASCCSSSQQGTMKSNSGTNSGSTGNNSTGGVNMSSSDLSTLSNSAAALYQNAPNPFSQQTSIGYFIPTSSQSASIMLFDLQGKLLKPIAVTNYGNSAITINGNELSPGMYVYSLVVDGKIIDTKRMILTQ